MNSIPAKNTSIKSCSIVVPIYNTKEECGKEIVKNFNELRLFLKNIEFDLVVVEDGSDFDKCIDYDYIKNNIREFQYIALDINQGKGAAIRVGVNVSHGDIIIYTDNDFPYSIESMASIVERFYNSKVDLVIGVRPKSYYSSIPRSRKWISKMLQIMNQTFMDLPTSDTQAGLKGFSKRVKSVFLETKIDGFLFDLEFLKLAKRKKMNIALVEIHLRKFTQLSEVKIKSLLKEILSYFRLLIGI